MEDLQVANMTRRCKPKQDDSGNYLPNNQGAKSGLNKSFADAGLSQFVEILIRVGVYHELRYIARIIIPGSINS